MDDAVIHHGDCLDVLRTLPDCSVDAVVTDPPYGLSFMGRKWDYDVPSVEVWAECLRVLKPGGHLLAFAGTRTQHRMCCRIEDAGFEIRDMIAWVYGSGFPKSKDVSKAIDEWAGAERTEVVGSKLGRPGMAKDGSNQRSGFDAAFGDGEGVPMDHNIYAPATAAAKKWHGWGTALKPALEPITVARKPIIGTVAENVLTHGTGAINVDGCRVEGGARPLIVGENGERKFSGAFMQGSRCEGTTTQGRWPANLILDGSDEVVAGFPDSNSSATPRNRKPKEDREHWRMGGGQYNDSTEYGDTGSAARFFYCAKASKRDRDEGLDHLPEIHRVNGNKWTDQDYRVTRGERPPSAESGPRRNVHPTVKPTDLMRYLCRLVTPPGGVVLDPFAGSGSTGKAAVLEGFGFIGIEREAEYVEIARARIAAVQPGLFAGGGGHG